MQALNIYLLLRIPVDSADYEEYEGFVVRAKTPAEARQLALDFIGNWGTGHAEPEWGIPAATSCKKIGVAPERIKKSVVLLDANRGE